MKGSVTGTLPDGRQIVTADCGCEYVDARAPMVACEAHRYITCGGCGGQAEVTPIGVLCLRCTFGQ